MIPASISRIDSIALSMFLVKTPAPRPYTVLFARAIASLSSLALEITTAGPKSSCWAIDESGSTSVRIVGWTYEPSRSPPKRSLAPWLVDSLMLAATRIASDSDIIEPILLLSSRGFPYFRAATLGLSASKKSALIDFSTITLCTEMQT